MPLCSSLQSSPPSTPPTPQPRPQPEHEAAEDNAGPGCLPLFHRNPSRRGSGERCISLSATPGTPAVPLPACTSATIVWIPHKPPCPPHGEDGRVWVHTESHERAPAVWGWPHSLDHGSAKMRWIPTFPTWACTADQQYIRAHHNYDPAKCQIRRRSHSPSCSRMVHLHRRSVAQALMRALVIVEPEVPAQPCLSGLLRPRYGQHLIRILSTPMRKFALGLNPRT